MIEGSLFAATSAGNWANVMIAPAYHIFPKNQAISPDMITDNE